MPSVASSHATLHPGLAHADFVIGDRDGNTASPRCPSHLRLPARARLQRGLQPSLQGRGAGAPLRPAGRAHRHQIEINRKLYERADPGTDQAGYLRLTTDLKVLVEQLMATDPRALTRGG
jgi:N-formylglutamate deformylase